MKGRTNAGTMGALAALALAGCGSDALNTPEHREPQILRARAATERYQNVSVALADGFVAAPNCASAPGQGAMGIHYSNPGRLDATLAIEQPETLLYLPENGVLRLVGVEYVVPVFQGGRPHFGATTPTNLGPTPILFGQRFDGPMAGHNPSQSWHYELHLWVWRDNPAGMFAPYNPRLSCPS